MWPISPLRALILCTVFCLASGADAQLPAAAGAWSIKPADQWSSEVRVWDAKPGAGLLFEWSGGVDAGNQASGYGTLYWKTTGGEPVSRYVGDMVGGMRSGEGLWVHRNGARYEGAWRDNLRNGRGRYSYASGDYYEGEFRDDLMHGSGKYVATDGTVYEGAFVAGERDGRGVLVYPDGRRVESQWSGGAQMPGTAAQDAPMRIPYIAVAVDVNRTAFGPQGLNEDDWYYLDSILQYQMEERGGQFYFTPTWPAWTAYTRGGPIRSEPLDVGVHPAYVQMLVFNDSPEPLTITGAELAVSSSEADLSPLLFVVDVYSSTAFGLHNIGWGAVRGGELRFNIQLASEAPRYGSYRFSLPLAGFDEETRLDLSPAMRALGMDPGMMTEQQPPADYDPRRAFGQLSDAVQFYPDSGGASLNALIVGEIRIDWVDQRGVTRTSTVKFEHPHVFSVGAGAEMGAGVPTSGRYDVSLPIAGNDYVRRIAYQRTIAPGGNDRVTLGIASSQSAEHAFRIRLRASDGSEIVSPLCHLHFVIPRGSTIEGEDRSTP